MNRSALPDDVLLEWLAQQNAYGAAVADDPELAPIEVPAVQETVPAAGQQTDPAQVPARIDRAAIQAVVKDALDADGDDVISRKEVKVFGIGVVTGLALSWLRG